MGDAEVTRRPLVRSLHFSACAAGEHLPAQADRLSAPAAVTATAAALRGHFLAADARRFWVQSVPSTPRWARLACHAGQWRPYTPPPTSATQAGALSLSPCLSVRRCAIAYATAACGQENELPPDFNRATADAVAIASAAAAAETALANGIDGGGGRSLQLGHPGGEGRPAELGAGAVGWGRAAAWLEREGSRARAVYWDASVWTEPSVPRGIDTPCIFSQRERETMERPGWLLDAPR